MLVRIDAQRLAQGLRELAEQIGLGLSGQARVSIIAFVTKEDISMGAITVKDVDSELTASVTFLDAKGNPTEPDDLPVWASSDENVATVTASSDGLTATVTPGNPGAAVVSVSSTNSSGDAMASQGTVTVLPGPAESIGDVTFEPAS